jgi:hypothetical protein
MKRTASIEALIRKSRGTFTDLREAYEKSLHEKTIREDLRVDIKNIFENLRSCLDYLANELFERHCPGKAKPDRLYFPIRSSAQNFAQVMVRDFSGAMSNCRPLYDYLESIQPYHAPWLGQFNKLNNENKHQNLSEQTRTATRRVSVTRPGTGGGVSWGPGVTFGSGVSVMGVPIDPRTQLPVPNNEVQTTITTWVDFRFADIDQSVLPFMESSINNVEAAFKEFEKHC